MTTWAIGISFFDGSRQIASRRLERARFRSKRLASDVSSTLDSLNALFTSLDVAKSPLGGFFTFAILYYAYLFAYVYMFR